MTFIPCNLYSPASLQESRDAHVRICSEEFLDYVRIQRDNAWQGWMGGGGGGPLNFQGGFPLWKN